MEAWTNGLDENVSSTYLRLLFFSSLPQCFLVPSIRVHITFIRGLIAKHSDPLYIQSLLLVAQLDGLDDVDKTLINFSFSAPREQFRSTRGRPSGTSPQKSPKRREGGLDEPTSKAKGATDHPQSV